MRTVSGATPSSSATIWVTPIATAPDPFSVAAVTTATVPSSSSRTSADPGSGLVSQTTAPSPTPRCGRAADELPRGDALDGLERLREDRSVRQVLPGRAAGRRPASGCEGAAPDGPSRAAARSDRGAARARTRGRFRSPPGTRPSVWCWCRPRVTGLESARSGTREPMRMSGSETRYGASPAYAPASSSTSASRARSSPSCDTAVRILTIAFSRLGHVNRSSGRVSTSFTGRPVALRQQGGMRLEPRSSLAPKPPPM